MIYVVSACLLGKNCKYNGGNNYNKKVIEICGKNPCIEICPESFGGLLSPREPAEIINGTGMDVLKGRAKVKDKTGKDLTENFISGARASFDKIAKIKENGEEITAILKAKSPSCGCGKIYDGSFSGRLIEGDGVAAALFRKNGIKVVTEKDIDIE